MVFKHGFVFINKACLLFLLFIQNFKYIKNKLRHSWDLNPEDPLESDGFWPLPLLWFVVINHPQLPGYAAVA